MMVFLASMALGGVVTALEGEEVVVPVEGEVGVMLELPDWVQVVTPSKGASVDPVRGKEGEGVKRLQVGLKDGSDSERLTFVLASGRHVAVRLVRATEADRFVAIRMGSASSDLHQVGPAAFLSEERSLLKRMFDDDPVRRTVLDEEVAFVQYPDLSFRLVRRHSGAGLTGFTFVLRNVGNADLELHPEVLSVGYPNRAALVQVDHEVLAVCGERTADCETVLRLVVVDDRGGLGASGTPNVRSVTPFVVLKPKKSKKKKGKKG